MNHIALIIVTVIASTLMIGFIFYEVYYLFFAKSKSKLGIANVERIIPLFVKGFKKLDVFLEIYYSYIVKNKKYFGSTKIEFKQSSPVNSNLFLTFNEEIELPVLYYNGEVFIGNEAIEHMLLTLLPQITIRYLKMDPSRSFVIFNKDTRLASKKIKNI